MEFEGALTGEDALFGDQDLHPEPQPHHKRRRDRAPPALQQDDERTPSPQPAQQPAQQQQREQEEGGGAAASHYGSASGVAPPPLQLSNSNDLTPIVLEGLQGMQEHIAQVFGDLDNMEQSVVAFLDKLKDEWRQRINMARASLADFQADTAASLCRVSDEAQVGARRRDLLVAATHNLNALVANLGGAGGGGGGL